MKKSIVEIGYKPQTSMSERSENNRYQLISFDASHSVSSYVATCPVMWPINSREQKSSDIGNNGKIKKIHTHKLYTFVWKTNEYPHVLHLCHMEK